MKNTLLSAWKNAKFETTMLALNSSAIGLNASSLLLNGPNFVGFLSVCFAGGCTVGAVFYYKELIRKINNAPSPN